MLFNGTVAVMQRDQVLALAGIFQAAALAQQLAHRGSADEIPFEASVRSLFIKDAINTASVYGGEPGVRLGLQTMRHRLSSAGKNSDFEVARYVLSLTQLGFRLGEQRHMAATIAKEIEQLKPSVESHNGEGISQHVYSELARIYKDTISYMKPKIIVQGGQGHLSSPVVVDKVRTILFAGVRSAFLWNQLGGKRWHLVFKRRQALASVESILAELDS